MDDLDLLKAIPTDVVKAAYDDAASPALTEAGKFVADLVRTLRLGVSTSVEEAARFREAYSESPQSGWIVLSRDCVAALDGLADEIENGWCGMESLQALKGTVCA